MGFPSIDLQVTHSIAAADTSADHMIRVQQGVYPIVLHAATHGLHAQHCIYTITLQPLYITRVHVCCRQERSPGPQPVVHRDLCVYPSLTVENYRQ